MVLDERKKACVGDLTIVHTISKHFVTVERKKLPAETEVDSVGSHLPPLVELSGENREKRGERSKLYKHD